MSGDYQHLDLRVMLSIVTVYYFTCARDRDYHCSCIIHYSTDGWLYRKVWVVPLIRPRKSAMCCTLTLIILGQQWFTVASQVVSKEGCLGDKLGTGLHACPFIQVQTGHMTGAVTCSSYQRRTLIKKITQLNEIKKTEWGIIFSLVQPGSMEPSGHTQV